MSKQVSIADALASVRSNSSFTVRKHVQREDGSTPVVPLFARPQLALGVGAVVAVILVVALFTFTSAKENSRSRLGLASSNSTSHEQLTQASAAVATTTELAPDDATADAGSSHVAKSTQVTAAAPDPLLVEALAQVQISALIRTAPQRALVGKRVVYVGDEIAPGLTLTQIQGSLLVAKDLAGASYTRIF